MRAPRFIGGATTQVVNGKEDKNILICTLGIYQAIAGERLVYFIKIIKYTVSTAAY